jgi:hypothetical protein
MAIKTDPNKTRAVLCKALVARSAELGIDSATFRFPSPTAIVVRCYDGGVFRVDFGSWSSAELAR